MDTKIREQHKGDPSDVSQYFPGFSLKVHCCRFWWLKNWEFGELSFPFWRIYHNPKKGAFVKYAGQTIELMPDTLYMIAPNTSYSSWLFDHKIPESGFVMEGERVESKLREEELLGMSDILHLFIHFNIGMPYDNVTPGIYTFKVTNHILEKLQIIKEQWYADYTRFSFYSELAVHSLINDLLAALPTYCWNVISKDSRILSLIKYIQKNLDGDLTNRVLAGQIRLATNAFTRLFTEEVGVSPQRYVKRIRIDKARVLLHHSSASIDQIASQTGFADRYHFSRIFKQVTGISPAHYRKAFELE